MEPASKDTAAATARGRQARKIYLILGMGAVVVVAAWFGHRWWTRSKQTTDDAQVESDVVPVAARVSGVVKSVPVHDNQAVKAGDVLFELDTADLDIEVSRAEAELEAARAQQAAADAQVTVVQSSSAGSLSSARAVLLGATASVRGAGDAVRVAEATIARATADLATAESDLGRVRALVDKQAGTRADLEHAQQARDVAKATLDATNAQLSMARAQQGLAQARIAEAEGHVTQNAPIDQVIAGAAASAALAAARVKAADVALARAKLQRSYATVTAPTAGVISRLGAHAGQHIA